MEHYILKQYKATDKESYARQAFKEGMYLYGYCCGYFGRDSYGKKLITAITEDSIEVIEDGVHNSADIHGKVFSWVELLESSNHALETSPNDQDWSEE